MLQLQNSGIQFAQNWCWVFRNKSFGKFSRQGIQSGGVNRSWITTLPIIIQRLRVNTHQLLQGFRAKRFAHLSILLEERCWGGSCRKWRLGAKTGEYIYQLIHMPDICIIGSIIYTVHKVRSTWASSLGQYHIYCAQSLLGFSWHWFFWKGCRSRWRNMLCVPCPDVDQVEVLNLSWLSMWPTNFGKEDHSQSEQWSHTLGQ